MNQNRYCELAGAQKLCANSGFDATGGDRIEAALQNNIVDQLDCGSRAHRHVARRRGG
jgi:hypothetical protein